MNVGILVGAQGTVKRTWALVSGQAAVPVAAGDEILEWHVEHGSSAPDPVTRDAQIRDAAAMQDTLPTLKTLADALRVSMPYILTGQRRHRRVLVGSTTSLAVELMYRSDGTLASRPTGGTDFPTGPGSGSLLDIPDA